MRLARLPLFTLLFLLPVLILLPWDQSQAQLVISDINFIGNERFDNGDLAKIIMSHDKSWFKKILFWTDHPLFDESTMQDDGQRLRNFYISEGYTQVQIIPEHVINGEKVKITFRITENNPVRITQLVYDIQTPDSGQQAQPVPELPLDDMQLETGARFTDKRFTHDNQIIIDHLINAGYPRIDIKPDLNLQNDSLRITYHIHTGPFCRFGETRLTNIDVPERILRKQLAYKQGDVFNQTDLQDTQQKLYTLGVFQYVSVNAQLDSNTADNSIPVDINLKEGPMFRSQVGFGYGKEDRFRVSARIIQTRFLGSVRRLTIGFRHSYLEPYNANIVWLHPLFLYSGTTFSLEPFLRKEREPGYQIRRYGMGINLQTRIKRNWTTFFRYALENDKLFLNSVSITELQDQTIQSLYNKSSVTLGIIRDTSSPIISPESGSYYSLTYTLSGLNFDSQYHFQRLFFESRHYIPITDNITLALKTKWGAVAPWKANETIPLEERFFAGGYSSVRGWQRSRLGPLDPNGQPVGGKSLTDNSIELRYPIMGRVSGALFMDFGYVWSPELTYSYDDWHYSPGTGLFFNTPIGPIRFDVAVPLPRGIRDIQYYINVGHAF